MTKIFPATTVAGFLLSIFLPSPVWADAWQDYNQLLSTHYMLDKQPVARVTCSLNLPTLDQLLSTIAIQFPEGSVDVKQNLKDFAVTYVKGQGISFVTPTLEMRILSYNNISNAEKALIDSQNLQNGFAQVTMGTENMVLAVLEGMLPPQEENIKNLSVQTEGGIAHVSYSKDGQQNDEVYNGNSMKSKQTTPAMVAYADTSYVPIKGKLFLSATAVIANLEPAKIKTVMQVQYQNLGDVVFPSQIFNEMTIKNGSQEQTQKTEINFKDCHADPLTAPPLVDR